jgi:phosphoribosyl-AMP cyclohydrolase
MVGTAASPFAQRGTPAEIEAGLTFMPKFDATGLIPAVATDADTGAVLMVAWMNAQALQRTLETAEAHFFSRSRGRLWRKGEESGNTMSVAEVLTDCDQDTIWLRVRLRGNGAACHTGQYSCFYRRVPLGSVSGPLEPAGG